MLRHLYSTYIKVNYIRFIIFLRKILFNLTNPNWKQYYNIIDNDNITKYKTSDTIFIFGSGYSLNDITDLEFKYFEKHDTLSFNWFVYQKFIKVKFQMIREICLDAKNIFDLNEKLDTYRNLINNDNYKDTVFLMQNDLSGTMSFEMLNRFILPLSQKLYFFKTFSRNKRSFPNKALSKGLIHSAGTLTDCISFAYAMNYKQIVFVGVDLYDKRYFWLKADETNSVDLQENSNFSYKDKHKTADPILKVIDKWQKKFTPDGIQMYTYNPKSLLNEYLPVYKINHELNN